MVSTKTGKTQNTNTAGKAGIERKDQIDLGWELKRPQRVDRAVGQSCLVPP